VTSPASGAAASPDGDSVPAEAYSAGAALSGAVLAGAVVAPLPPHAAAMIAAPARSDASRSFFSILV
jgi:hypothetical protein